MKPMAISMGNKGVSQALRVRFAFTSDQIIAAANREASEADICSAKARVRFCSESRHVHSSVSA
jgi:hypothetical protein